MKKFVILASQRTGSNMLVSTLRSHPDIDCHGELFRRKKKHFKGGVRVFAEIDPRYQEEEYLHQHWREFLDRVVEHAQEAGAGAVGFKIMMNQSERIRRALIEDRDWTKILLKRENVLAVYSSNKIAKSTGQGSAGKFAEVRTAKTEFVNGEFKRFLAKYEEGFESARQQLAASGQDYLDTSYREICSADGMRALIAYIGMDPDAAWEVSTQKRNPSQLLERFTNPDAVGRYLDRIGRSDWRVE